MSSSNCCFLACIQVSQEAGQVVWYFHLFQNFPQFIVIDRVKGFGIVNKAEIDVFLELSCFFNDSVDVGNLISGSSAFSKTSLNIRLFMVHVLLKPGLENSEHYFTSMWDECHCAVVWAFFGIAFLWDWNENWPFPVCGHCWVFQMCWHIECSTFTASSFRIWNSSTEILSPPLALFVVMLQDDFFKQTVVLGGKSIPVSMVSWNEGRFSVLSGGSIQFSSVAQSCPTLCDPMDCSTNHYFIISSRSWHSMKCGTDKRWIYFKVQERKHSRKWEVSSLMHQWICPGRLDDGETISKP